MEANQIIHNAMGYGIHNLIHGHTGPLVWTKCSCGMNHVCDIPDYSQPENIGKVHAWMQLKPGKGFAPRCRDFNKWWLLREGDSFNCLLFTKQVKVISEWITEEEERHETS